MRHISIFRSQNYYLHGNGSDIVLAFLKIHQRLPARKLTPPHVIHARPDRCVLRPRVCWAFVWVRAPGTGYLTHDRTQPPKAGPARLIARV